MRAVETLYFDKKFQLSESRYYLVVLELSPQGKATSTLGTQFQYNQLVSKFNELILFSNTNLTLAGFAFRGSYIEEIMLPKQLKILGSSSYSAIYGMTKLKEIVVPQSVTVLGGEFSRDCGSLERIIIYGKVVTANVRMGYALQHLNFLVLPDTISSISQNDAFSRTYALTTIICNAATPPALANNNLFAYAGTEQVIYIPDDSVSDYSAGQYWGNYTSRFKTFSQLREEHPDWYEAYVVKDE